MQVTPDRTDATGAEIAARLGWITRLRWLAIGCIFLTTAASHSWLGAVSWPLPIYVLGLFMLAYNAVFHILHKRILLLGQRGATRFAVFQMGLDLVMLTLLLHFSGGIENPFLFYFIFHIILSSILLPAHFCYGLAGLACVLVALMSGLEAAAVVPHYPLIGFPTQGAWRSPVYLTGIGIVFTTTILVAAYLSTSTMAALRRRENELRDIRDRMAHHEKLAGMGQFAAGIAHEVGNPISSIISLSDLMISETKDEAALANLKALRQEAQRISTIIRHVMDFARPATSDWHKVSINDLLEDALKILRYDHRVRKVQVVKDFSAAVPASYMMPQHITQVFTNLFLNALDAMGAGGGRLTIRTAFAGGQICVSVEDTGAGMTDEELGRVFEPFFTTKPPGKGTGLGLAVSLGIVERHGGDIVVRSEKGKGTRVEIRLPLNSEG